MKSFEKPLFYLFLASIPLQLGKHLWPPFAFIDGIRVDYLSPTIYISDILFLLFFFTTVFRIFPYVVKALQSRIVIFSFAALFLSSVLSVNPFVSFLGFLKFLECFYIAYYIGYTFKKKDWKTILLVFVCGGILETGIILAQFFLQHSIGGVFYYLGERTFSTSTPGIATFYMNGEQILRGYGTFPHPNVAAFYLFIGFVMTLFYLVKGKFYSLLKYVVLTILFWGIIATFSRILILLAITSAVFGVVAVHGRKKGKKAIVTVGLVVAFLLVDLLLLPRFANGIAHDWMLRAQLLSIFLQIFLQHILFGVGFNSYFNFESIFQKTVTPMLLQPVHNIFLLWLVQTGLGGLAIMLLFLKVLSVRITRLMKKSNKTIYKYPILFMVGAVVLVGFFDHYLLTLQQGQLMLSLILGFCFSKQKINAV